MAAQNSLTGLKAVATMSSLELVQVINDLRAEEKAELRHSDFMVKLEKHPGIDSPKFFGQYKDSTGRSLKCYNLPERECKLMVMSESLEVQTRVLDRMIELEAPKPLTTLDILKLAMESEEGRLKAEAERDLAIATKAQIGSSREATCMARVALSNKEVARLTDQLGFSVRQATILQVEYATGQDYDFLPLRRWCNSHEVVAESVPDKRYPRGVKAWPAAAWRACYGIDLPGLIAGAPLSH